LTPIDPAAQRTIDPGPFRTESRNCPFAGWRVRGRAGTAIVDGVIKYPHPGSRAG
jgi:dihydroorotase